MELIFSSASRINEIHESSTISIIKLILPIVINFNAKQNSSKIYKRMF